MKKIVAGVMVLMILILGSVSAFTHPNVPEQSRYKVNPNAKHGIHMAAEKVQNANGAAAHVFEMRFNVHNIPK